MTLRSETRNQRGEIVQTATVKLLVSRHSMSGSDGTTTKARAGTGILRAPAGAQTKPEGQIVSCALALGQTDTAEQAEWRLAHETHRERVDPRSRADTKAIGSAHDLPPITDEAAAAERRGRGRG